MRGVSRGVRRAAAVLGLVTVVFAHGAMAAETGRPADRLLDRIKAAKHFIVTIFGRLGTPPG